eukprot:5993204-Alexandrium_andersonii.AAC.1
MAKTLRLAQNRSAGPSAASRRPRPAARAGPGGAGGSSACHTVAMGASLLLGEPAKSPEHTERSPRGLAGHNAPSPGHLIMCHR